MLVTLKKVHAQLKINEAMRNANAIISTARTHVMISTTFITFIFTPLRNDFLYIDIYTIYIYIYKYLKNHDIYIYI
jgi:hypothetical protein